jgi:pseudouridine synthase
MPSPVQPERLWQRLKGAGFGTRGELAALFRAGAVRVDGKLASALTRLTPDSTVTVDGEPVPPARRLQYWLLNKPVGIDCCIRPEQPHSIAHVLAALPVGLRPAGRLDRDSSGALLLTNDGKLCQRLMHPDFHHEKEYAVRVDKEVAAWQLEQLRAGASYQVGQRRCHPRPCVVTQTAPRELRITLTQGMHRQIRRMCRAAGLRVLELRRLRLNRLLLGELAPGAARELGPHELTLLEAPALRDGGRT